MNKYKFLIFTLLSVAIILSLGFVSAVQTAVNLGTAGDFVILSKAGISTTGTTLITGDIGVSPIDSTAVTGFDLIGVISTDTFLTSALVTGKIYAANLVPPTPSKMTTAVSDMETAYTDAAGRTETSIVTELGAGDISGLTLAPGLYKWGTGVLINGGVTLSGGANEIWIFQIGEDLTVGNGAIITLSGGAQAKNIFWQVAGQTTLGTTSQFKGIILCQTLVEINTGATLNGRALAQTAVTLDANAITSPGTASSTPPADESDSGSSGSGSSGSSGSNSGSGSSGSGSSGSNSESGSSGSGSSGGSHSGSGSSGSGSSGGSDTDTTTPDTSSGTNIVSVVGGVSVTKTRDGETIEISSVDDRTRLKSNNIKVETELPVEVEGNIIRVTQSNGIKSEIKIMPSTASETAIARLGLKVCNETNNCTIILKEVGVGADAKVAYQLKAQKNVKVLGLFKAKMNVEANVDAETGKIISEHKPLWHLISTDAS